MPKHAVRQSILTKRKALSASETQDASARIQSAFLATSEFIHACTVALYSPVQGEVETSAVFSKASAAGKTVLFPAVTGDGLVFRRVTQMQDLQRGVFGVWEPILSCEEQPVGAADIIVIPGVVFDLRGNRIGYGKGFYDRTVHSLEGQGRLAAFCYDFQVINEIIGEPHDVKVDMLITEKRVIRPRD